MARIFPERLSRVQKGTAQRRFLAFSTINALSYALLAESVLVLFGLKLGANDFQIGLLSSYVYLTMGFILLGKVLVGRWGAARTYSTCWSVRNLVAATFMLAPVIWTRVSPSLGLTFLLAASFVFFAFRAMGLAAENILINDMTGPEDRGRFIGQWQFSFYIGMLAMLVAVSFWLGANPGFGHFQVVIATGVTMGMISSAIMWSIPESSGPKNSSRVPMLKAFSLLYADRRMLKLILAWAAVSSVIQLIVPFQVLTVKNGYNVADRLALIFVVLQVLGMVAASYMNSLLIDRSGPRPVMIINLLGFALVALLWAVSPARLNYAYTGTLFFFAGFCTVSLQIALAHYFLNTASRESVLNISVLILVLQGAAAGLVGTFLGGGVLETLDRLGLSGMEIYHTYFCLVIVAALVGLGMVLRLRPLAERRVREVLGMMFSVRDWRALMSVQELAETPQLERAHELIDRLADLRSEVSERTLLEYLDSPIFTLRTAALEALDRIEFGPEASWRLIEEVKDGEFSTAWMAAEILGKHRVSEAITTLRESLHSNDFFLEGKAMQALGQMQDSQSYPRIKEIFRLTYNPRLTIHGARAIYDMGERENVTLLLEKLNPLMLPAELDEIMHAVFALLGRHEEHFRLMTLYNRSAQQGLDVLAHELEKGLEGLGEKVSAGDAALVRAAMAETAAMNRQAPEQLVRLLQRVNVLGGDKARYIEVLLRDSERPVREAPPRLRFGFMGLAGYLLLERTGETEAGQ
ncbi:MFS transporter [bacterium]|nr:MFS transporter [bacterium]